MTIQVTGGFSMIIFALLSVWVYYRQATTNARLWGKNFKERYIESKRKQGLAAVICALISLLVYFFRTTEFLGPDSRVVGTRILSSFFLMLFAYLVVVIARFANYLAKAKRLENPDKKDRSLLALKIWQIPDFRPTSTPITNPHERKMLQAVQDATAKAVYFIEFMWLLTFVVIVPTIELWITQGYCLVFGVFRII